MLLYDAEWAPSPRRVRIFLAEKGLTLPTERVDLKSDAHLSPDYLSRNPRGTVPALLLDSGELLTESPAICRYLEALHPDPPLFGATPLQIARTEEWLRRVEEEGYAAAVYVLRNGRPAFAGRGLPGKWPPIEQIPALVARGEAMWAAFCARADERLSACEWIAGDRYGFADVTLLVTVDFARAVRLAIPEGCRHLAGWHARADARPSARA